MRRWWQAGLLLAALAAAPVVLLWLQRRVPVSGGWSALFSGALRVDSAVMLNAAALLGWVCWAWVLCDLAAATVHRIRRVRTRAPALAPPTQRRVSVIAGAAVLLADAVTRTTTGNVDRVQPAAPHSVPAAAASWPAGTPPASDPRADADDAADGWPEADGGVEVPGGWLPAATAAALTATAAGVWLNRRRRHRPRPPGTGEGAASVLPAGLRAARRAAHAAAIDEDGRPLPAAPLAVQAGHRYAATIGSTPSGRLLLADLPGGGLGLVGPGGPAAARAALIAAAAAGWPLVATAADLTALLTPAAAAQVAHLPGAVVVADLPTAIGQLTNIGDGRPVLLLAAAPPPGPATTALAAALSDPAVTAVLLGAWPARSWHLGVDGTTGGSAVLGDGPVRLGVLDQHTSGDLVATLAAAVHPPDAGRRDPGPAAPATTDAEPYPSQAADPTLRLRVLGPPELQRRYPDGSWGPVYLGRAAAWHILIYLAAHRRGATTDELKEALWPDVASSAARHRFNTTISQLRRGLTEAAGALVLHHRAERTAPGTTRHWLDPHQIEVDLWCFRDACHRADTAIDPAACRKALRDAVAVYHGELAQDRPYDWAEPLRDHLLRRLIDAYTYLADIEPDHHAALNILQQAIRACPHNEDLYRQAMRRHAATGNNDGVRRALATLAAHLAPAHQQPDPETTALADTLLNRDARR